MDHVTDFELEISQKLKEKRFRDYFFQAESRYEIARQIRQLRQKRGMRQADLAEKSGMPQSSVSRIEQAEYSGWTYKTLCKVASALDARLRFVLDDAESVIREFERKEKEQAKADIESGLFRSLGILTNPVLGRTDVTAGGSSSHLKDFLKRNSQKARQPNLQRQERKENETTQNRTLASY